MVTYGDTIILAAVNSAKEEKEGIDFFPLQVEYREKTLRWWKNSGGFFKREAKGQENMKYLLVD